MLTWEVHRDEERRETDRHLTEIRCSNRECRDRVADKIVGVEDVGPRLHESFDDSHRRGP